MSPRFGIHGGLQHTTVEELRDLWRKAEDLGFDWISVWDHFYAAGPEDYHCHEAVAMHAALACSTTRVRCGCLVYSAGYRQPGVLAKAIATIDHLSGGRAEIGLGAGWAEPEYRAYGFPFPGAGARLDLLEEAAACVRGLLRNEATDFDGDHFQLRDAHLEPRPVQAALPVWIGGGGERRTLRIAARYADGWNVPYISPADFAHKRQVLADHCAAEDRDPAEIRSAINLGISTDEESLAAQYGVVAEFVRPGVLIGHGQQLVDRIGEYLEVGADQVNIVLRAPWEPGLLELAAQAIAPHQGAR
ncbi:MAG: TIGR03560 family F420-dependent LLM class oxidoreductase [Acidimicrobiales bacterium]